MKTAATVLALTLLLSSCGGDAGPQYPSKVLEAFEAYDAALDASSSCRTAYEEYKAAHTYEEDEEHPLEAFHRELSGGGRTLGTRS